MFWFPGPAAHNHTQADHAGYGGQEGQGPGRAELLHETAGCRQVQPVFAHQFRGFGPVRVEPVVIVAFEDKPRPVPLGDAVENKANLGVAVNGHIARRVINGPLQDHQVAPVKAGLHAVAGNDDVSGPAAKGHWRQVNPGQGRQENAGGSEKCLQESLSGFHRVSTAYWVATTSRTLTGSSLSLG